MQISDARKKLENYWVDPLAWGQSPRTVELQEITATWNDFPVQYPKWFKGTDDDGNMAINTWKKKYLLPVTNRHDLSSLYWTIGI